MSEWKEVKLKELGRVVTGTTPSSKFPDEFGSEMPFVTPSDYKNYNKWISSAERYLSDKGITKLQSRVLPKKSLLVTCIGSNMGKVAINKIPVVSNQQINSIVPNENIDADFLYYKLIDSYDVLRMYGEAGTAVPIVNKGEFENIEIVIPENKSEQRSIAEVLSSLDDKIDLLHRQNKTLEQLAETLFRQWFVEEADESWEIGNVNDLVKIQSGFAFKSSDFSDNGIYRIITIKNVQDGFLDSAKSDFLNSVPRNMPEHCLLLIGDILLSLTGNVGRCCLVDADNLLLNQRVAKLKPLNERDWAFTYIMFRQTSMRRTLEELAKGTAQANLSPIETGTLEIQIPPQKRLEYFSKEATPLIQKVLNNKLQIRTLTQLRDTLLPKLMSGEVRVKSEELKVKSEELKVESEELKVKSEELKVKSLWQSRY